jgi:hypothetical protein
MAMKLLILRSALWVWPLSLLLTFSFNTLRT